MKEITREDCVDRYDFFIYIFFTNTLPQKDFVVPHSAHLDDRSKYFVHCGLRSNGVVTSVTQAGASLAAPIVARAERKRKEDHRKREAVRSLRFLANEPSADD